MLSLIRLAKAFASFALCFALLPIAEAKNASGISKKLHTASKSHNVKFESFSNSAEGGDLQECPTKPTAGSEYISVVKRGNKWCASEAKDASAIAWAHWEDTR